jgi:adenylate cyclase
MGFADLPADEPALTDADVKALELTADLIRAGIVDTQLAFQQTRVMGQAMATIAAAQLDVIADAGRSQQELVDTLQMARRALPASDELLLYLYRRHLAAVNERAMLLAAERPDAGRVLCVGFADLVGFTASTQQLDEEELARLVDTFSLTAADVVAEGGGRVVKMIGDEVMYTNDDAAGAACIALDLLDAVRATAPTASELRAGLAVGPVVTRSGDVFGAPVNVASRLVSIAKPDSVVVSPEIHDALEGDERFVFKSIPRRRLKGIGTVRPYVLRRAAE